MADGYSALTEKEKETLRLLLRGHDAKSAARHLGLSVHTVNERLRDARRKLAVSSSREAARMVLERESGTPESVGDTSLGVAPGPTGARNRAQPDNGRAHRLRATRIAAGVLTMSIVLAIAALSALPQTAMPAVDVPSAAATEVEAVAERWLVLLDEGRWGESYALTGTAFRQLNTEQRWATASERVRAPLGPIRSRTLLSHDEVPAPPQGYDMVRFRTDFANKSGAVETVTLDHEDGGWRVVGVTVG